MTMVKHRTQGYKMFFHNTSQNIGNAEENETFNIFRTSVRYIHTWKHIELLFLHHFATP